METEESSSPAVLNLGTATFQCVYPTCGGVCCRNGRPAVDPAEIDRIARNLDRFLPRLRPAARRHLDRHPFVTRRLKDGRPTLAVTGDWCVFFNEGCVLHEVGASEGSAWTYKPANCIRFPLEPAGDGSWYVRQRAFRAEGWDLSCLDPATSDVPAACSLGAELEFICRGIGATETCRRPPGPPPVLPAPIPADVAGRERHTDA